MIKLICGKCPAVLRRRNSAGANETREAKAFYRRRENHGKPFPFKVYKHKEVLQALERLGHGKCAYCESLYGPTAPADTEHYRPKGAVVVDGQLRKPGYYWLAAAWSNLLPSCIDCNRARTHSFPDADRHLAGKANQFPIANEASRAKRPGQEVGEQRLLLHPCLDDPEQHLEFTDRGEVYPRKDSAGVPSRMGSASIEVYGLFRWRLVGARASVQVEVEAELVKAEKLINALRRYPGDEDIEDALKQVFTSLKRYTLSTHAYAGMCRQTIRQRAKMLDIQLLPLE